LPGRAAGFYDSRCVFLSMRTVKTRKEFDMADADSLVLFIRNTGALYPSLVASDRRLALKKVRGVYDRERAASEFAYIVEEGAKRYVKELGESEELPSVWHVAFPKAVRDRAAREMVDYFETHYRNNPENFEKTLPKKYQGGKHAQTQLSEDDLRARRKGAFSLAQLEAVPTISEGHTSDLKWDTGRTRVWLSRMTKEDGMPYDNQVTVEVRQPAGKSPEWKTALKYQAKGRPLSQFLLPRLEAEAAYFRAQRMFPGKHVALGKSEHPGQAMLQSTQLTRNQLLKTLKVQHDSAASLRRAMAKVKKHESGGNPRVSSRASGKKHPLDAKAVARIERAAARRHVAPSRSAKGSRKRAPFTGAQRKQRGLAPLDAGLKARVDALVGRSKK
jgi:hypothetical protein